MFLEQFKIPGTVYLPYVNWNVGQFLDGKNTRATQSGYSGNLYTSIDKIGGITKFSTIQPWEDYLARDVWITNLYAGGKISYQTARQGYLNTIRRVAYALHALDMVHTQRQERILMDKVKRTE